MKLIQKSIPNGRIKTQSLNILVTFATPQIKILNQTGNTCLVIRVSPSLFNYRTATITRKNINLKPIKKKKKVCQYQHAFLSLKLTISRRNVPKNEQRFNPKTPRVLELQNTLHVN